MPHHVVDRPLRVGEVLAETVRLYGERLWASLALGAAFTGALVLGYVTHGAVWFVVATFGFGATYAASARIAAGDPFREALSQVAVRGSVLAFLCLAVALPFVASLRFGLAILLGAAWLAFSGFAIPVAMLEPYEEGDSWFGRVTHALDRSVRLARAEYLHALGVVAALLIVEFVFSRVVEGLLRGFADNSAGVSAVLAGILLWPLVFLGLSVLYFEQRVRLVNRASTSAG